jgi:hypothetical protein
MGIIFLFISVALAPSINSTVVKASNDNDLVEVTTQACGIKGYGNTTVKLTKQQYQSLQQYLVDFRARLNQTTTREEAIPIYKEAVVELNKYGLLPKGMSVENAQMLVTVGNQDEREMKLFQNTSHKYQDNSSDLINNYFCLVTGKADDAWFINPIERIILFAEISGIEILGFTGFIFLLLALYSPFQIFDKIFDIIDSFYDKFLNSMDEFYWSYWGFLHDIQPFLLGGSIGFNGGNGWIQTIGLNGTKKINGSLYGQIPYLRENGAHYFPPQGIQYFVGLKIYDSVNGNFLLGSAFRVKIGLTSLYPWSYELIKREHIEP